MYDSCYTPHGCSPLKGMWARPQAHTHTHTHIHTHTHSHKHRGRERKSKENSEEERKIERESARYTLTHTSHGCTRSTPKHICIYSRFLAKHPRRIMANTHTRIHVYTNTHLPTHAHSRAQSAGTFLLLDILGAGMYSVLSTYVHMYGFECLGCM